MIRIYDTQGLDYENSQDYILKEVKRIVKEGFNKGPDNYINIFSYRQLAKDFKKKIENICKRL